VFHLRAGDIRAVDGVSFDIPRGGSVGIVGESGSGKSITALSIMRLIRPPGEIVGGSIWLDGLDLLRMNTREMRRIRGRRIALVSQEPTASLNPILRIGDQVAEAVRVHDRGARRTEVERRVLELLESVEIPDAKRRARQHPHSLSGGMQQRVVIATALANRPDLLILDEPTTAVDATIQAQILDLIQRLREEINMATLLITHDLAVIAEMVDEVIVMYGGRVMEHGRTRDVITTPKHPYSQGLLAAIPTLGMKKRRLQTIPGTVANPLNMPSGCPFAPRCPDAMAKCASFPPTTVLPDARTIACWLYATPEVTAAEKEGA
jgi:oligopeptide/dipeptide ABC transporter ATP-binding protein